VTLRGILCALAALSLGAGCGGDEPSGPKKYPVSGTVHWEGKPIPKGHIIFAATDRSAADDAGKIVDGKYELRTTPGEKKVRVYAEKIKPTLDNVMGQREREMYIPARYNTETELKAKVTPEGPNQFDFLDLKP